TALSTMMQHQSEKPPSLKEATLGKEFSFEIETIISRLLEKEPEKRYQSLKVLARDLSLLQQGASNQSLTFTPTNQHNQELPKQKISYIFTLCACLATMLITGLIVWFVKDYIDNCVLNQKLAAALETFKNKEVVFDNFGSSDTVQSSTLVDGQGRKWRRIFFEKVLGFYNIVGSNKIEKASGIINIPFEKSIHLRLKDPDCVSNPKFFNQFQPGDITELSLGGDVGVDDSSLKSLPHLSQLTYLNLVGNEVSDASIPIINQLPLLQSFYADKSQISVKGILSLKRLKHIEEIGLGKLHSISPILKELTPNIMHVLNIDMCDITVDDIKTIAHMKNLQELSLYRDHAVTDETFKLLLPLKNLERLDLGRTGMTAASIDTLKKFPKLKHIQLLTNQWKTDDIVRCRQELNIQCDTYISEADEFTGESKEEIERQARNLGATN
ncbi:MAG: hypothetical protein JST89_26425, partial [Cyanobacteria bacterium SZAS-4]|nr:hypothetical protein [Cyanobacteria bacterium SZAS-4]